MYILSVLLLIVISFFLKKKDQMYAFLLLFFLFLLKSLVTDLIYLNYPLKDGNVWILENSSINFILNNSSRIIQHLTITFFLFLFIYKDRRCFIPILINTVILVLYTLSNLFILFADSYAIQHVIYGYRYVLGSIVVLSLFDYGEYVYDRMYSNSLFTNNKYVSRLYSIFAFRCIKEDAKRKESIV